MITWGARAATGAPGTSPGYGPLVDKGDGQPTPGTFDGMAAFRGRRNTTILIRNHENRERPGEQKVLVPSILEYDGRDPLTGQDLYIYEVLTAFAILGGTSTNCAGAIRHGDTWITCEEASSAAPPTG